MIDTKQHKIYPTNGSFDLTMNLLVEYIKSKYDVFDTLIQSEIKIDETKVGYDFKHMEKPNVIYINIHHMKNKSWTNAGGTLYISLFLMDRNTIDIRWDTEANSTYHEPDYKVFDINKFRKMKLEKLNKC